MSAYPVCELRRKAALPPVTGGNPGVATERLAIRRKVLAATLLAAVDKAREVAKEHRGRGATVLLSVPLESTSVGIQGDERAEASVAVMVVEHQEEPGEEVDLDAIPATDHSDEMSWWGAHGDRNAHKWVR